MSWTKEILVYISGFLLHRTWTVKRLAELVGLCEQTDAKWLGILQ